jgi:CRP/FNR family transcriptional regulator
VQLLTERQQLELGRIATEVSFRARAIVHRAHTAADDIFFVDQGVIKSFRDLPSGKRRIMTFLFAGDVFGLAEGGQYVNTTQAVTPARVYRIPYAALADTLRRDSELDVQFLYKVTHELRESQRRQIVVTRRDAPGRLAMFLRLLEHHQAGHSVRIDIPMSRGDIADYLSLSPEAVSRAAARLSHEGIVSFPSAHVAHVVNRARFERLADAV